VNLSVVSWPAILTAIGSVIVLIGVFWAALEQNATDKKLEALSEENRQLSKQLHEALTGGNSYPKFLYAPDIKHLTDPDAPEIFLAIQGDKMIYDARIEHVDLSESLDPKQFASIQDFIHASLKTLEPIKGGNFFPNRAFRVGYVRMKPQWNERRFGLGTIARNGVFSQVTTLRRDKTGRWYMADFKITKERSNGEPDEVLQEVASPIDPPASERAIETGTPPE
jgi:hypothetical protein